MNRFVLFFSFLLLLSQNSAAAGTDWADRGNGGDVIACAQLRLMYDSYEAVMRYGLRPDYPLTTVVDREDLPVEEVKWLQTVDIAQKLIDRLKPLDEPRWRKYSQWLKTFKDESRFVEGAELFDVPDTGIGFVPQGCELKQLVIQREPRFPHDRRYIISMGHWFWLDPTEAAAGVLHELMYRDVTAQNPEVKTSEAVRYFNALVLSNEIRKMTPNDYLDLLRRVF